MLGVLDGRVESLCGGLEVCGSVWGKPLEDVNIANSFSIFLIFFFTSMMGSDSAFVI